MFKILVPTDGSEYAYRAVEFAGVLASRIEDAEITVLTVMDLAIVSQAAVSPSGMPVTIPVSLSADIQRALDSVLEETQQKLAATGRNIVARREEGRPAEVICRIAEKEHYDMIVMGASGQGRIADILLGSVSDKVVHKSKVPVVIVKAPEFHER